jgi:hypothetical protein
MDSAAGGVGFELSSNPRLFGTAGFFGVGSTFVSRTSRPRPGTVRVISAAGTPTVTIGDISDLPPPKQGDRAEFDFNMYRADFTFPRGAVIEFRG